MDKREKDWTSLTEDQENTLVDQASNLGSIPIARAAHSRV